MFPSLLTFFRVYSTVLSMIFGCRELLVNRAHKPLPGSPAVPVVSRMQCIDDKSPSAKAKPLKYIIFMPLNITTTVHGVITAFVFFPVGFWGGTGSVRRWTRRKTSSDEIFHVRIHLDHYRCDYTARDRKNDLWINVWINHLYDLFG